MRIPHSVVVVVVPLVFPFASGRQPARRQYDTHDYYVLEHHPQAGATVSECAGALGLELVEQAGELRDHWLVRIPRSDFHLSARVSERGGDPVLAALSGIRQQSSPHNTANEPQSLSVPQARRLGASIIDLHKQTLKQRTKRAPPPIRPPSSENSFPSVKDVEDILNIQDPIFGEQWHIVNEKYPEHMMNVTGVWEMGITGKGIISALVDDGLDFDSDDLRENFDASGSWDYNDHVPLPKPVLWDDHHGTRCAGEIAAVKNNVCGVGLAYGSKVAGIRILSGPISDVDEAAALNLGYQNTSIYSCSWGPTDDGRSMEAPNYLIQKAIVNGIVNGRGGKGSIFVFASGNGASAGNDQCNFDGYTNSIYSVTVSAIDYKGLHPYYSEACAANMVVTYSSGSGENIHTTDVGKDVCSSTHGGTSAAAPLAVGIFALALEVRPELTWRDIQHLCVQTARMINPDDPDWETMASGRKYSYKYGFGKLDGYDYVTAAKTWKLVKPQAWVHTPYVQLMDGISDAKDNMTGGQPIGADGIDSSISITSDMLSKNNFETLEHITVQVWIQHSRRGDVEVSLMSPNGVKSVLAARRKDDSDKDGFPAWTFMTVKHWEEKPVGDWTLHVSDQDSEQESGKFIGWRMTLWGSAVNAARAKPFVLMKTDGSFPPSEEPELDPSPVISAASSTKFFQKPTAALPDDHHTAEGEADKPAFSDSRPGSVVESPAPSMSSTPDEGWFSGLANLKKSGNWLFGAISLVALFGFAACGYFWWQRRQLARRRRAAYTAVDDEDVPMGYMSRGDDSNVSGRGRPRTKELYDAFGEVSDDDEDADEETRLHPGRDDLAPGGLTYHQGFLEDDEPASATTPIYRDELPSREGARSLGSGDGSGSWEHASDVPKNV